MAPDNQQDDMKKFGKLVARAWSDPAFKKRLVADPKTVLHEQGIAVPAGAEIRVVENTDTVVYVNLPRQPEDSLSGALASRPMLCYWSVCCSTHGGW
jgi:hypothetical protein